MVTAQAMEAREKCVVPPIQRRAIRRRCGQPNGEDGRGDRLNALMTLLGEKYVEVAHDGRIGALRRRIGDRDDEPKLVLPTHLQVIEGRDPGVGDRLTPDHVSHVLSSVVLLC